jgi:uncharacterized protein with ParB-like and HNH nuclease domain
MNIDDVNREIGQLFVDMTRYQKEFQSKRTERRERVRELEQSYDTEIEELRGQYEAAYSRINLLNEVAATHLKTNDDILKIKMSLNIDLETDGYSTAIYHAAPVTNAIDGEEYGEICMDDCAEESSSPDILRSSL